MLVSALSELVTSKKVVLAGGRYIAAEQVEKLSAKSERFISAFHKREPLSRGVQREAVREAVFAHLPDEIFQFVIVSLIDSGRIAADR
jgi:hypothetical protein